MRNLGPGCERDLNAVGILTADDVIRLGVEETFVRMLVGRQQNGHPTHGCNANYLYALHGAIHDLDWRQIPEQVKRTYKSLAAEIRESGQFSES